MRAHFLVLGDSETAEKFHDSSMEFVRSLGGDPLCLVTELPLFLINRVPDDEPEGVPETYLRFKQVLPQAKLAASNGRPTGPFLDEFDLSPVSVPLSMKMQMEVIDIALSAISIEE